LKESNITIRWGGAEEAAFLQIMAVYMSGKTPILYHYDPNKPALVDTEASDVAIARLKSQKFKDGKLHSIIHISKKLSPVELKYNVFDKEMIVIVFSCTQWRHFLQGAEHRTIVYSDHQNVTYFKSAVALNRWQAHWAVELAIFNFDS
jgi:hypothetical protein